MSADNGIYILKTKDGFRVIHAQAIENVTYEPNEDGWNPYEIWAYFHRVAPFTELKAALARAHQLYKEHIAHGPVEYGVCDLDFGHLEFPSFTIQEYENYQIDLAARWAEEKKINDAEYAADIKARTVQFEGELTNVTLYGDVNGRRAQFNLPRLALGKLEGLFLN